MTYNEWIESFQILSKYDDGLDSYAEFCSEHDVFYSSVSYDILTFESEDGKKLDALGWSMDGDVGVWVKYT